MKQFIQNCFAFVAFAFTFYLVLTFVVGSVAPETLKNFNYKMGGDGFLYSRVQQADTTHNIDILFLGSSHAYRGYDTRIFQQAGYRAFNLGSSAQTPTQTEILVDKYLDQFNPKTVILDVYPITFASDGVESALDLISNAKLNAGMVKMGLETKSIKVVNSLMFSFLQRLLKSNSDFREPIVKKSATYISGGYVQSFEKYKPAKALTNRYIDVLDFQMNAFNRIISRLRQNNTNYLLVQAPITKRSYQSFVNNQEIDTLFHKKGTYYNFNKMLSLPDSVFSDDSHLNQSGVNIYNKRLLEIIGKKDENLLVKNKAGF